MSTSDAARDTAPAREVPGADLQTELAGLSGTVLDLLWVHPLLVLLAGRGADGGPRVALWPLVLLAVGSRALVWLLERRDIGLASYRLVTGAALVLSLPLLLWLEFYAAYQPGDPGGLGAIVRDLGNFVNRGIPLTAVTLVGGWVWWQTLSGRVQGVAEVYGRFTLILGTGLLYVVAVWLARADFLTPVLTRDLFLVFVVALWTLALARSRMEQGRSHQVLSTRWFVFSLSLIGGVLGLGLLVGSLFGQNLAAALFGPLMTAVQLVGLVVIGVLTVLLEGLFYLLDLIFGGLRRTPKPDQPPPPSPARDVQKILKDLAAGTPGHSTFDPGVLAIVGFAVLAVVVLLVLRAILGSAERRRRGLSTGERESLLDWPAILRSLTDRVRPEQVAVPDPLLALAANPAYRYTVRVRQAYRRALAAAAARGTARLPGQTAPEVLPALQSALPGARDGLRDLTTLYDATRYTGTPATAAEAEHAERLASGLDPKPSKPAGRG